MNRSSRVGAADLHGSSLLSLLVSLAFTGCPGSERSLPGGGSATASASSDGAKASSDDRLEMILTAEHRRSAASISEALQQSRDVTIRRAAARALARIGGEAARPGLQRALTDEDEDVLAWGAYGIGFFCKGHEKEDVSALVARAVAWVGEGPRRAAPTSALSSAPSGSAPADGSARAPRDPQQPRLDAFSELARAVGRCGAEESEPTLVAWLAGPRERAVAAVYALGDLAAAKQKLREETLVALLNVAAGSAAAPPVPEALFPVGRLEHVPLTVIERIREVSIARLAEPGDSRLFAVRALGRSDESAAVELKRVLTSPGAFNPAERAEAVKALKRLGRAGQRALAEALPGLLPSADPVALTGLVSPDFGVLLTALSALSAPGSARKALTDLATLPPPPSAPLPIARRISWLRCSAAKVLAGADFRDKFLAACDVTAAPPGAPPAAGADSAVVTGSIGARAVVEVLSRQEIKGPRLTLYRAYARGGELRAREAALELLEGHEEIEGAAALLAEALSAKESGLIATAAEVVSKQPQRATEIAAPRRGKKGKRKKADKIETETPSPSPALLKALLSVLGRPDAPDDPEMLDAVIDAVGALGLKEVRPRLDELCRSSYPTTREHTERALGLLGGERKTCEPPPEGGLVPAEMKSLAPGPVTLTLDADVGSLSLTLDPEIAPVIVSRVVELARAGYYNGMVVHRVDAGFVTQFGAPSGDGYGGPPGKPAVRCETTPLPFAPLTVGVALAGRDTGSSQLFVMHGRYPHLDGRYAIVGSAVGPWASFVDGDVLRRVTVNP